MIGGKPGKARQPYALTFRIDLHGVVDEVGADDLTDAGKARIRAGGGGQIERLAAIGPCQREAHMRVGERDALDDLGDRGCLGAVGLEEFQPGGRCEEEVAHLHPRAAIERGGDDLALLAAIDGDFPAVRLGRIAGGDRQPCHGADGGQRLAAKPERADIHQVVFGQFRGAVALDREREIGRRHARTVVGDAHERLAAGRRHNLDARGAGVKRVLDQFLHHRGRSLDHLAGGDAIDDRF